MDKAVKKNKEIIAKFEICISKGKNMKESRHAYMIMAHNDFDMLYEILRELDYRRNDIFLHIDRKSQNVPIEHLCSAVKEANLVIIPRKNVNWGGYTQIACELHLMRNALESGHHAYYHMMTGAMAPIKSQEEIFEFFDNCGNKEFIGFDNSSNFESRVCLYHIYNEIGKATTKTDQIKVLIINKFNGFQKKIGYIYKPTRNISFKKGFVYWSLTEDAIKYILINEKNIKKIYKHSFCGDELFIQTLLYNSEFRKKIYNLDDEYESCLRFIKPALSWNKDFSGGSIELAKKSENSITVSDLPMLVKSEKLYGWKFVGEQGIEAIKKLRELREKN